MDGTQDLLSSSGKLSQESDQVVSGLTVETGSRFIEEEKQVGLGGKFDTDGDSLSSFNRETVTARWSAEDRLSYHVCLG